MSAAPPPFNGEIRILTSLRMVAATWVVLFHFTHFTQAHALINFPLVRSGYLGVDFFFILSGFVLSHVYLPQVALGKFDYWHFVVKRFARIYPMHIVTLIVFLGIGVAAKTGKMAIPEWLSAVSFAGQEFSDLFRAFVANLTMIHAWGSTNLLRFNQPSWSISAEWFAYLMFPLFVLGLRHGPKNAWMRLITIAVFFALLAAAVHVAMRGELTQLTWNVGILRIVPEFLLGMALYRLGQQWSAGARGSRIGFALALAAVVIALMIGGLHPKLTGAAATVAVLALGALVLFAADADRHGALGSVSGPFAVYLGEISYSIYMVHLGVGLFLFQVVLGGWQARDVPTALAVVMGGLVAVTLVSAATYRWIEIPARRWLVSRARTLNAPEDGHAF